MGFSMQAGWSRLPFPTPGDCLDRGIEPMSLASAGGFFTTVLPGKPREKYEFENISIIFLSKHLTA